MLLCPTGPRIVCHWYRDILFKVVKNGVGDPDIGAYPAPLLCRAMLARHTVQPDGLTFLRAEHHDRSYHIQTAIVQALDDRIASERTSETSVSTVATECDGIGESHMSERESPADSIVSARSLSCAHSSPCSAANL